VPDGLSAQDQERYKAAFTQKAEPFLKKAQEALRTCAETAQQLRVFSQAAKACMAGQVPARLEAPQPGVAPKPTTPEAPQLRARLIRNPSDGEALVQLALLHLRGGDVYGAKLVADRAVEVGGASLSAAHNVAGLSAYQLGEHGEAHRHFQEALRADKRNPRARLNHSVMYREYGYSKLIATELGGLSDIPSELVRDPAVLPGASLEEKK
jgi:tetratricopeptide (TPR) repeat protein